LSDGSNMNFPEQPENPYAAATQPVAFDPNALPVSSGMVNQVTVVGILQIVVGAMELLMGAFLLFYAGIFGFVMPNIDDNNADLPPPEAMFWISIGLAVGGLIVSVFAVLRIVTGINSFWFKQRTMMLVSLIGGMVTVLTCYCSLFSVGVGIYGLIVMLDPAVKMAYQMSAEGVPAEEIKARFARARFGI
jgi:hypothetical protein